MTPVKRDTTRFRAPDMYPRANLSAMLDDFMWQGIEDGYRRLAANEADFASYRDEMAEWTGTDSGSLAATAAEEYPQYNS